MLFHVISLARASHARSDEVLIATSLGSLGSIHADGAVVMIYGFVAAGALVVMATEALKTSFFVARQALSVLASLGKILLYTALLMIVAVVAVVMVADALFRTFS